MSDASNEPEGFEPEPVQPPDIVPVSDEVRDRMVHVLAAMLCGATPEATVSCLEDGHWPRAVAELLGRRGEREELSCHADVLLSVLQSPAPVG
jgi:hypothetical protein